MNTSQSARLAIVVGLALCAASARCQARIPNPVAPSDIDRTQFRGNARSLGMGGTDLIVSGDATAAAFNPASIAAAGAYSEAQTVVGRTSNVHVDKINDLSKGLKDLGDQFNSGSGNLSGVRDAFQKVYSFATDAGSNDTNGSPANVSASLAPLAGFSVQNVGLVGYGTLAAKVQLRAYSQAALGTNYAGLGSPSGAETAAYGVLGLTNIAVPFGIKTPVGMVGIAPRYVQASYAGAGFLANETDTSNGFDTNGVPNGNISGATYKEVHQAKLDTDVGFTSIPDPIYHIRGAIVIHNLLSPTFHLPRVINSSLGIVPGGGDFSFQEKPQIDIGGLGSYDGLTYAAELHNVNGVNGGKHTIHLGVEYPVVRTVFLRGGYDNSRFVAGLGFAFGGVRLDIATGQNPQEQVAIGLTISK